MGTISAVTGIPDPVGAALDAAKREHEEVEREHGIHPAGCFKCSGPHKTTECKR